MTPTMVALYGQFESAGVMDDTEIPDPEVPPKATRRRFAPEYKARILAEYERLADGEKGALLRREGLYSSLISEWRKQRDRGALEALGKASGRPPADPVERENARLVRENERLTAELAKARKELGIDSSKPNPFFKTVAEALISASLELTSDAPSACSTWCLL